MSNVANLPARPAQPTALERLQEVVGRGMSPALAIMLDPGLFEQTQAIAEIMSKAQGFTPGHLIGKREACFAVTTRALVWQLDPFAVAQATYQPAEGAKVAYEAKLVQAIIEQSGRLVAGVEREYYGDWNRIRGKFVTKTSDRGKKYQAAAWQEADEEGLGVIVRAKIKGEDEKREIKLDLRQAHPRNSTLWATDPATQLYYRAVRMFGNVACPSLLMGVPFRGEEPIDEPELRDVTPAAQTAQNRAAERRAAMDELETIEVTDAYGAVANIMPGEVEAWARSQLDGATPEQVEELAVNNPQVELFRGEAEKMRAEAAKSTRTIPLYDESGAVAGNYTSGAEWLTGLENAARTMPGLIIANWDMLTRIATSAKTPDDVRERAQRLREAADELAPAGDV